MDLSWNDLVGGSLKALTAHLQHVGKLRVLKLCSCRLTDQDLTALGEALDCIPLIEALDLSWNVGVGAENFRHLTEHLQPQSTLKELRLVDCQLSESDITALSKTCLVIQNKPIMSCKWLFIICLPMLSSLEELDLSNSKLSIKGMENFTSSLGSAPQMKTLKLSILERLNLSWKKCVGKNLRQFLEPLQPDCKLQELRLSSCNLTTEDVLHLESACQRRALSHLKQLNLSYNGSVGDGGWTSLFEKASALKGLEELDVSLRPSASLSVSPWLPALLEALPQLSSLTRLSLQHWALSLAEREKLEKILSKKNVILECDSFLLPPFWSPPERNQCNER
uniref:Leucine rich repeat containing 31 n=1 Tax=Sinocyclocheilus grahami TaxID=75366 RepID=A0A672JWM9_SINGR